MKRILSLILLSTICGISLSAADLNWKRVEAYELNLCGKAFDTPNPYHRVDTDVHNGFVGHEIEQCRVPAGLTVLFKTNADRIGVSIEFGDYVRKSSWCAYRGFDLYFNVDGKWKWAGSTTFKAEGCKESAEVFIRFGGKGMNTNDLERFVLVKKDGAWKVNCGFGVIGREPDELAEIAAKQGRALFVEMLKADMERGTVGLGSLWPHSKDNLSDDKDDIAGNSFATADAYFDALFDVHAKGQSSPYVKGNVKEMTEIFGEGKGCGWLVAVDVSDESPDTMPMLVSANVNPADLPTAQQKGVRIIKVHGRMMPMFYEKKNVKDAHILLINIRKMFYHLGYQCFVGIKSPIIRSSRI